ncbi:MAG: hypothetical protein LBI44_08445 [Oscillospiraceae bacterium]|jgi:opacity protein-like surface antigen|nr:hypothetical protein [Oscillospiraceae bacterium]
MKTRKVILSLCLAALLAAALALPAAAADLSIPVGEIDVSGGDGADRIAIRSNTFTWEGGEAVAAADRKVTNEMLMNATKLVLEFDSIPDDHNFAFVWQSSPNWGWNQNPRDDGGITVEGNKVTFDFAAMNNVAGLKDYKPNADGSDGGIKYYICSWGSDVPSWGLKSAVLTYSTTGGGGGSTGSTDTGDSLFIFVAVGVLALCGVTLALVLKKKKA